MSRTFEILNRVREASANPIAPALPKPPSHCTKPGCTGKTAVLFMAVTENHQPRCGAASDFTYENERTHCTTMRPGYEFVRWIARCPRCYLNDVDSRRTNQ